MTKTTATSLNIWTLGRVADGRREFPNRIESAQAAGMRRCVKAGLVEVIGRATLRLTDAGCHALGMVVA